MGILLDEFERRISTLPGGQKVAIILRDGHDSDLRDLFKRHDVFVKLDRLAREHLHVFYADDAAIAEKFDSVAANALPHENDQKLKIVFGTSIAPFGFENVEIYTLEGYDDVGAFQEIYELVRTYGVKSRVRSDKWSFVRITQKITTQAFAAYLGNVAAS
ncbi:MULTISPECIES: hypothetical protein [Citromicrobium]|uniref:hypothetical protein n=1 Tax=Citromicrobium TaxID=72173 RepID=UPI0012E0EFA2|nr:MULTISPECIES: hypothetical protein [Citromicrobium]